MPAPKKLPKTRRKTPEMFGFLVAWLEERKVCGRDVDLILPTHRNGWLRPQVEEKLAALDPEQPLQADLHHRVSQALELFEAIDSQAYRPPSDWGTLEPWLKRALAYFVKNGDAIPDHFADGYEDDHREFVQLGERLGTVLNQFELWRRNWGRAPRPGSPH